MARIKWLGHTIVEVDDVAGLLVLENGTRQPLTVHIEGAVMARTDTLAASAPRQEADIRSLGVQTGVLRLSVTHGA